MIKTQFDKTIESILEGLADQGKNGLANRTGTATVQPQQAQNVPVQQNPANTAVKNPAGIGNSVSRQPMKFQHNPQNVVGNQQQIQNPGQVDENQEFQNMNMMYSENPEQFKQDVKNWDSDKWIRWVAQYPRQTVTNTLKNAMGNTTLNTNGI